MTQLEMPPEVRKAEDVRESGGRPSGSAPNWDLVDEASWESFPASDPPCYASGREVKTRAEVLAERARAEAEQKAPERSSDEREAP